MLSLIPTPIGNLKDITLRSLEVLAGCAVLLCEDVRVTKRLLFLLEKEDWVESVLREKRKSLRQKRFLSFHSHNQEEFLKSVESCFFTNQHVGFVSDAGMPCVSDPGARLVRFAQEHGVSYEVLPGPSACVSAYCASGFEVAEFHFVGFLPPKSVARRAKIASLMGSQRALVIYESPRRLLETLGDLASMCPEGALFAIKEMSKLHACHFKGTILEVSTQLQSVPSKTLQGEWVLVCLLPQQEIPSLSLREIEDMDLPPKIKAKLLSKIKGISPKTLYAQDFT
ncbi:16S rRNA (cytidine(1402)-2'-O)-methyltransferase [Helicobacter cynogastricus]|uniref:16S rRNA (cytidine(1402)-2'-O)-methyltransferase n=1 Tax=Helicobacter cynogastricus TaxID=329937 RepID=UPI000CF1A476|nr:16S rRNA (cytidine(1402)-2'-O)-methyltransferase [Helicobacter cynogastricus]